MPPPLHYPPEQTAAPVQFVDPGQLFYNPPPPPAAPVYRYTSPTISKRAPTPVSQQSDKPKIRPLTVDEALQFSPLASIIPFDAGMIPLVSAEVKVSDNAFVSKEQQAAGVQQLQVLDNEAARRMQTSEKENNMARTLAAMLKDRNDMESIKFTTHGSVPKAGATPAALDRLGPFARLLLEKSKIGYRYGPPDKKVAKTKTSASAPVRKPSETSRPASASSHRLSPEPRANQPPQTPKQTPKAEPHLPSPQQNRPQGRPAASPSLQLQPSLQPSSSSSSSYAQANPLIPGPPIQRTPAEKADSNSINISAQPLPREPSETRSLSQSQLPPPHPRYIPAIHVPPVPAELQSTPPSSQHSRLVPAVHVPAVPPHDQLVAAQKPAPQQLDRSMIEVRVPPVLAEYKSAIKVPSESPQPPISSQSSGLQIVIPGAPFTDPRDSCKTYSTTVETDPNLQQYQDHQRAAADATIHDLQNVLNDIFDAEFEAQAGGLNSNTEGILTSASGPDGEIIVVAPSILVKLDSALRKVIERRRLAVITVDQILQLQTLCERSFSCAENMQLSLVSDWPSLEESTRNAEAGKCEHVLKSARVILRTMSSAGTDKQIIPEERLQKCITLLNKVVDSIILPTVEARTTGADASAFQLASSHKRQIGQIMFECNKLMQILLDVLSKEDIADTAVNEVEYFVIRMLFVENGPTEKESVLGIAKFEAFRRLAMLVLVEIFTRYQDQRSFIIREVLSSLQKLPTARQQGRQFKLDNGKRLQLVTVLLIRLVQASGVNTSSKSTRAALRAEKADLDEDNDSESDDDDELTAKPNRIQDSEDDDDKNMEDDLMPAKLVNTASKLHESAVRSAWQMVVFLVGRAATSSKTGETPHRHLLDMFVEDLVNVLGMAEWPGAELLLQMLVTKMNQLVSDAKTPAPAKTMALETLGTLGTAILDITFEAQHVARSLENDGSKFSVKLIEQLESHTVGQLTDFDVVNWKGPFRSILNYLEAKSSGGQAASAQGFILTKWTKTLMWGRGSTTAASELDEKRLNGGARELATSLCRMMSQSKWADTSAQDVSEAQARLAYLVSILHIGFCQAFTHIVSLLLGAITSDQITVKARGLKSVTQMLEKDPALLDRYTQVMQLILRCAADPSASVRDNSLALLGKCITLRPSVEKDVIQTIMNAATDSTVGIRKRGLKLLRDAYLRDDGKNDSDRQRDWRRSIKSQAVNSIFRRITDEESTVVELVQQIFEEIWLDPLRATAGRENVSTSENVTLKEQVAFMIETVCDHGIAQPLQDLFKHALSDKGKSPESSRMICKALIACAFEGIIDPTDIPGAPPQHRILQILAVYARIQPKLFTGDHVELLKPYVSCLSNNDDLALFRGVVIIFRCVLPTLPTLQQDTLKKVQLDLLQVVSKLPKGELDEVASCLWTISSVLKSPDKLVKLMISVLNNLQKFGTLPELSKEVVGKAQRMMRIAGYFGKYCDFQPEAAFFEKALPSLKGKLVAGKIVSGLQPFTLTKRPMDCKAVAWEAIGMICQSWPSTFSHEGISKDIQAILRSDEQTLQHIILTSIRDFLGTQDQAHDTGSNALMKDPLAQGKLGGSMTATDNDGAAALIAQAYLKHIQRISLSTTEDIALTATEVIASISRQGLIHPKEVGPALFALVTSPDPKVVVVALQQLNNLHSQHETLFEREYIRSINEAFVYQKNIVKDTAGYVGSPPRAKLHHVFEVIKVSKAKFVTKFLTNFCGRADFELPKLDAKASMPSHLEYARFLLENLPFFDFTRLEDVTLVINCLEKVVAATGSVVAHAINTELFNVTVESVLSQSNKQANELDDLLNGIVDAPNGDAAVPSIEQPVPEASTTTIPEIAPDRFRQIATASMTLTLVWEARTHLRRLYNINSNNQVKGRGRPTKDNNRAPAKNGLVSGDRYVASLAAVVKDLDSEQTSRERCRKFAELMAIDDELKVGKDDEEDMDAGDMEEMTLEDELRGVKRKNSTPSAHTPKKKRGRPTKSESRKSSEDIEMWE